MSDLIFGYTWEQLKDMQQRNVFSRPIDTTKPAAKPPNDADLAMLREHGSIKALEQAGLHGVADRLRQGGTSD